MESRYKNSGRYRGRRPYRKQRFSSGPMQPKLKDRTPCFGNSNLRAEADEFVPRKYLPLEKLIQEMESRSIVSASYDKTVRIWKKPKKLFSFEDVGNLRPLLEVLKFLSSKEVVGIARVSKQFYEACFHEEIQKPGFIQTKILTGHKEGVLSVALSQDKQILVSGGRDNTIRVWNLTTGELIQVLKVYARKVPFVTVSENDELAIGDGNVSSVAISNNNEFVIGSTNAKIRVWSLVSGEQTLILSGHTDAVESIAISSKNEFLVSGSWDTTVGVWDLATGRQTRVLRGHHCEVFSVAISKNDKLVASGGDDCNVIVWSLPFGEQVRVFKWHDGAIWSVVISSDNNYVVSACDGEVIKVWDISSGRVAKNLRGHSWRALSVDLSDNDKHLVSGGQDSLIKVWDLSTGKQIQELVGHTSGVCSVKFF
mmetsp:Transcript_2712/g.4229  ORF Transcript_2712/g.4229 Transcript_2712/m.4229 type:complete len:425 (+) Transcript_2712:15-1289(+)